MKEVILALGLIPCISLGSSWEQRLINSPRGRSSVLAETKCISDALNLRKKQEISTPPPKDQPPSPAHTGQFQPRAVTGSLPAGFRSLPAVNQARLIDEGKTIDYFTVRDLIRSGNLELSLRDSDRLYKQFPDSGDVARIRARALLFSDKYNQAFDVIVPWISGTAMAEIQLISCVASAHIGTVVNGEQEYCSTQIYNLAPDTTGEYLKSLTTSRKNTELLAWIGLAGEYKSHGFIDEEYICERHALLIDPTNPLIAGMVNIHDGRMAGIAHAKWMAPVIRGAIKRSTGKLKEHLMEIYREVGYIDSKY